MAEQYILLRRPKERAELSEKGVLEMKEIERPPISLENLEAKELLEARADPDTLGVARPMPVTLIRPVARAASTRNDERTTNWGIEAVGALNSKFNGNGTVVAVLDTGIDRAHVAFSGVDLVIKDFTKEGGNGHDGNGHGSHCAGTIFGRDVGGRRIGVAPGVKKALIGKVLSDSGGGSTKGILDALDWAAEYNNGEVDVISMSLGFDTGGYIKNMIDSGYPPAAAFYRGLKDHTDNLRIFDVYMQRIFRRRMGGRRGADEGVLIFAASGNENHQTEKPDHRVGVSLPAAAESVLSVGAAEMGSGIASLKIADFSNSYPHLCAPGVDILSAKVGGGLESQSGTSMACPHVAGVAALWWQKLRQESANLRTTAGQVEAAVRYNLRTNVFDPSVRIEDRGQGLVTAP